MQYVQIHNNVNIKQYELVKDCKQQEISQSVQSI